MLVAFQIPRSRSSLVISLSVLFLAVAVFITMDDKDQKEDNSKDQPAEETTEEAKETTKETKDTEMGCCGSSPKRETESDGETNTSQESIAKRPRESVDDVIVEEQKQPSPLDILRTKHGMAFNSEGELRQLDADTGELTDRPFEFDVFGGNRGKNQKRYEAIGALMDQAVFQLLEDEGGLTRMAFPEEVRREGDPKSFFFASEGFEEKDRLMVLIHGAGVVRAGQWARRLIINESLDKGTQLSYIRRAK